MGVSSRIKIINSVSHLFSTYSELIHSTPFDWKSPFGYSIVTFFQIIGIVSCSEVCVVVLCYYTGICLAITAFISDIEYSLNDFNVQATVGRKKTLQQTKIIKMFNEIIRFHSETERYSNKFGTFQIERKKPF